MFSQHSFRQDRPGSISPGATPTSADTVTAPAPAPAKASEHASPFDEDEAEDRFDVDDPYFNRHSRAASSTALSGAASPALKPFDKDTEEVSSWLEKVNTAPPASAGQPIRTSVVPKTSPSPSKMDRHSRGASEDFLAAPSSPGSLKHRTSPSPRPHHLSALSPLQSFSPLEKPKSIKAASSDAGSEGNRSRSGSLHRSLSRKQSLYHSASRWQGDEYQDENYNTVASTLFSRLTLVKAPSETPGMRKRSKSSSALAIPTPMAALNDAPATSARAPRRSFAASSFGGITSMTNIVKAGPTSAPGVSDAVHRISSIYSPDDAQTKSYTPAEVVDIARGLSSPVIMPEPGSKGMLQRRKSSGSSRSVKTDESPEKSQLALEPVEYVQLDEDTLLPFVERPMEVAELLKHPSNAKLFTLVKAAFPKGAARKNWQEISPDDWTWDEFLLHLTKTDRIECPDYAWVFRARQAVRKHSVALWEKVGVCLGCDGDLLNAGSEDNAPASWGGLGLGEEGEYDPSANQVWIEGLEAIDPAEAERAERALREEFGEIVEDEGMQAAAGMTALLGTIGEEEGGRGGHRMTTAQRSAAGPLADPINSPPAGAPRPLRSRSFVGLTIMTSPIGPDAGVKRSPTLEMSPVPIFERGPGSPLFPSSFSTLSLEPNLGRSASVMVGGVKPPMVQPSFERAADGRWGIKRKSSGAGLSESAITFASESEYTPSQPSATDHHE